MITKDRLILEALIILLKDKVPNDESKRLSKEIENYMDDMDGLDPASKSRNWFKIK